MLIFSVLSAIGSSDETSKNVSKYLTVGNCINCGYIYCLECIQDY